MRRPTAPGGRERYYPTLQGYLKDLKRKDGGDVSFGKAKLLVSEAGILLWHKDPDTKQPVPTRLNGNRTLQLRAARRFVDLNTVAPQTLLVSYYQMFGGSDSDAALVGNPRGESPFLDGKDSVRRTVRSPGFLPTAARIRRTRMRILEDPPAQPRAAAGVLASDDAPCRHDRDCRARVRGTRGSGARVSGPTTLSWRRRHARS